MYLLKKIIFCLINVYFFAIPLVAGELVLTTQQYADGIQIVIPISPEVVLNLRKYTEPTTSNKYPEISFLINDPLLSAKSTITLRKLSAEQYEYHFTLAYGNSLFEENIKSNESFQNGSDKMNTLTKAIKNFKNRYVHDPLVSIISGTPLIPNANNHLVVHAYILYTTLEIWADAATDWITLQAPITDINNVNAADAIKYALLKTNITNQFYDKLNVNQNTQLLYALSKKGKQNFIDFLKFSPQKAIVDKESFENKNIRIEELKEDVPPTPPKRQGFTKLTNFFSLPNRNYMLFGGTLAALLLFYSAWYHKHKFPQLSKFGF